MSTRGEPGPDVEVVVALRAQLGESPAWDARTGRLAWVDILGRRLHLTDPATGATESIEVPLDIGAVSPRRAGGFVAAMQDGFWVVGDGLPRQIATVPEAGPHLRFNDGKCDPVGRFWAGTMAYSEVEGGGALYRLEPDGRVVRMVDDVTISNGLAWTADAGTMFYVDSPTGRIDRFDHDAATGAISNRRPEVVLAAGAGSPDGLTIDTEGGLWLALWGGSAVHRYLGGRLDRVVELPVSRPTSCAFGGPGYDELYITSAWKGLTGEQRAREPLAGAVFRVRPGVRGTAPAVFAGG